MATDRGAATAPIVTEATTPPKGDSWGATTRGQASTAITTQMWKVETARSSAG